MKMRKILALIIALTMCISVFPICTFAVNYRGVEFTALDGTGNNSKEENYEKLFDGLSAIKWCDKIGLVDGINYTPYIVFKASTQIIIKDYNLVAANDASKYPKRNPKDWVLYGCNDYDEANKTGGTWVEIHTVTDDTVMQTVNYYPYNYKIEDNNKMYQYYKLEITANQGSVENLVQIGELQINWTLPYNITFDKNGGDTEANPKIIEAGQGLPTTNPTKAYHKFIGWYTKDGTNGDWGENFTAASIVGEDITVYAKWKRLYTVSFDLNGVTGISIDPVFKGDPIPTDIPKKGEMEFIGWFTKNGTETGDWGEELTTTSTITEDITVYAKWNDLTVIFDENGGDTPAKRHYDDKNDIYSYPCVNPTRTGYYFDGWWTKDGTSGDWGEEYTIVDFDNRTEKKLFMPSGAKKQFPRRICLTLPSTMKTQQPFQTV